VAPYLVPVTEFTPSGGPSRHLGEVHPEGVATAGARDAAPVAARPAAAHHSPGPVGRSDHAASPRLLELLALADIEPELTALQPYLTDPEPSVRRAAVTLLTETAPPGTGPAIGAALVDADGDVRATAAASLRELVETLTPEPALHRTLIDALTRNDARNNAQNDPLVRTTALDVLRSLRLGEPDIFADAFEDPDIAVRIAAVRGLVSVDHAVPLLSAVDDPSREVRVTVAKALAGVSPGSLVEGALARLTDDPDPLVRGAAYEALATTGCPAPLAARAVAAQADPAWQVRSGAATALSAGDADTAVPALAKALADPNADVRKAAVLALVRHAGGHEGARAALATATSDTDADVRAYASRAL
jgi:HEAT repeat protein